MGLSDEMALVLGKLSNYILIPNWFTKEVVEEYLNTNLTEEQYQAVVSWWNDSSCCSYISYTVEELLKDNIDQIIKVLEDLV